MVWQEFGVIAKLNSSNMDSTNSSASKSSLTAAYHISQVSPEKAPPDIQPDHSSSTSHLLYRGEGKPMTSPASFNGVAVSSAKTPIKLECSRCLNVVTSEVSVVAGKCTYITCLACCLVCLWPCYYYPFLMSCFLDIEHHCPVCSNLLGVKRPCQ
jgi:hypothetical protein